LKSFSHSPSPSLSPDLTTHWHHPYPHALPPRRRKRKVMPCTWTGYGEPLPRLPINTGGRKGKEGETERERQRIVWRETRWQKQREEATTEEKRKSDHSRLPRHQRHQEHNTAALPTP
jgi:hypothetical protein